MSANRRFTLSTDEAERLLRSCNPCKIAEWNEMHSQGKHPPSWSEPLEKENENNRGLTIDTENGVELFNVQMENLRFGPIVLLNRCKAKDGLFNAVSARRYILRNCTFINCDFQNLRWRRATIENCRFEGCRFTDCDLAEAKVIKSVFQRIDDDIPCVLDRVDLQEGVLEGTQIRAFLHHCQFDLVVPDTHTLFDFEDVDDHSSFVGMPFSVARVTPYTKSKMALAIRRDYWKQLLTTHSAPSRWAWSFFWRIVGYGFELRNLFAVYSSAIFIFSLSILYTSKFKAFKIGDVVSELTYWQSLYYTIVTMTTLGYGDISPANGSLLGYFVVAMMVTTGYLALGALVARLIISAQWPE